MKATNDLYKLIKSLTKTEKTYFKKFAVRHNPKENNAFLRLFNAFELKNDDLRYNENDIKKKFKNEQFINQLPVIKNYLYNTILKSLTLYYLEEKVSIKLNYLLNSANVLYDKELYNESLKILSKAEKIAEQNEMDPELLEIINIRRKVLRTKSSLNEGAEEIMKTYEQEKNVIDKMSNLWGYKKLYDELIIFTSSKGLTKNKEEQKELYRIIEHPLIADYTNAKSLHAKIFYHQIKGIAVRFISDIENAYMHMKELIRIIDAHPSKKKIFGPFYILAKQNLITHIVDLNKIDELDKYSEELLKENDLLTDLPGKMKKFLEARSYTILTGVDIQNGDFDKAQPMIQKILELSENNQYRDEEIVSNYVAAMNYFGLGELNQSLKYLNKIFNSKAFMLRTDVQSSSRIFNLILHYELGNIDSLEYFIKSTYRFLHKTKNLLQFEILTLKIIKKLTKVSNQKELIELLKEHRSELEKVFTDPAESEQMHGFDIIAWVDSKIQNKTYREVIKERLKTHSKQLYIKN